MFELKFNVTSENLGFSLVSVPVKINVMLESVCFPRVSVRVENQCVFGRFVILMGEGPNGETM